MKNRKPTRWNTRSFACDSSRLVNKNLTHLPIMKKSIFIISSTTPKSLSCASTGHWLDNMPITVITLQTWTNAKIRRTTVMFTLSVATLLVHLIALVFKDIQEMASIAMVMLINQCSFEYRMNTKLPIQIQIYHLARTLSFVELSLIVLDTIYL